MFKSGRGTTAHFCLACSSLMATFWTPCRRSSFTLSDLTEVTLELGVRCLQNSPLIDQSQDCQREFLNMAYQN